MLGWIQIWNGQGGICQSIWKIDCLLITPEFLTLQVSSSWVVFLKEVSYLSSQDLFDT